MFNSLLLVQTASALIFQWLGIGSAALFFLMAVPLFVGLALNPVLTWGKRGEISLVTYGIGSSSSVLTGAMLLLAVVEFFVPLVGLLHSLAALVGANVAFRFCRRAELGATPRRTMSLRPSYPC